MNDTKQRLNELFSPKVVRVNVRGVILHMRPLDGDGRDWLDGRIAACKTNSAQYVGVRREVVGRCLCNEDGSPLYTQAEYANALGKADGAVIDELFQHAQRISGLFSDDSKSMTDASIKN